jgi:molybdopterin-containing oxidoreductase family membrane subunit
MVPTMQTPYIPAEAAGTVVVYFPSWVEWSITAGAAAFFVLLYIVFSRIFPILSITEIAEPLEAASHREAVGDVVPPVLVGGAS